MENAGSVPIDKMSKAEESVEAEPAEIASENRNAEELAEGSRKKLRETRIYRLGSLAWSLIMLAVFLFAGFEIGSFARFVDVVTREPLAVSGSSDGIVVLTGGQDRIAAGVALLREQKAKRVLITGVNPDLTDETLSARFNVEEALLSCCIDLDRKARDTIANAEQAAEWANREDIKSIIVVTGALHMPRAMLEIRHALPDIQLVPHPVNVPDRNNWWRDGERRRDMVREYAKLSVVRLRDTVNEVTGQDWPNMPMRDTR
ncbi:MAG: YdcF family protein [Pseudomonadota bacterium]